VIFDTYTVGNFQVECDSIKGQ